MSRIDTNLAVQHVYICGGSGTGKSASIKKELKKTPRVLVFDPDDEYHESGLTRITSARELIPLLLQHKTKSKKIAFVGNGQKAFDFWARACMYWGDCLAVAEEIADVTSPSKASANWGVLVRRGRKYNIKIMAVTQRPAEADKTILTQAAFIRCHQLGRQADKKAIAAEMNIDLAHINQLKPLDFIEFARSDLTVKKGSVKHARKTKIATI